MNYSIGEFSALTGLSIHTLRYYEKERLIVPERTSGDRRRYSQQDVTWIQFIMRLKDTGMPIKDIRKYAVLRAQGDVTIRERMQILEEHRIALQAELKRLREHLDKLDDKITYYQSELDKEAFSP